MIKRIVCFFGDPQNAKVRWKLLYITLAIIAIADFFVYREHAEFFWDKIPGWSAFYGLISCVLIVFVSKFIGHQLGFMKKEDYYD
jgi:hypothetical protein